MKATLLKISTYFLLFMLMVAGCETDKKDQTSNPVQTESPVQTKNPGEFEGYVAGFQACDFNHHYPIGYVIILSLIHI